MSVTSWPLLREHALDLLGVPVYLPDRELVVTPLATPSSASWPCVVLLNSGAHFARSTLAVPESELCRAERVDFATRRNGDPLLRARRVRFVGGRIVQTLGLTDRELDAPGKVG